jgi:hypothetical protein
MKEKMIIFEHGNTENAQTLIRVTRNCDAPPRGTCCMGVTITHPLPPLKRGGLSGEALLLGIPTVIL